MFIDYNLKWRCISCSRKYHCNNYKISYVPSAAKYIFPERLQYMQRQFLTLSKSMPCKPNLAQIKNLSSIVNQSEISGNCFRKIWHLWGKGYFAAVATWKGTFPAFVKWVLFSFKVISKKGFFSFILCIFAVQSESEIRFLRSNLKIRFFCL